MVEKIDIKTIFLSFGDYKNYYPNMQQKDSLVFQDCLIEKSKVELVKEQVKAGNSKEDRLVLNVYQLIGTKIYLLEYEEYNAMFADKYRHSVIFHAVYSDSMIDLENYLWTFIRGEVYKKYFNSVYFQ